MRIEIKGADELNRKLNRIAADMRPAIEQATRKAVLLVHQEVPPYPAPPSGSTYRRTETLGRSITTEVKDIGSQIVGTIGTDVVYAPWVISTEQVGKRGPQAWMHRGRWWTLQGHVQKMRERVMQLFEQTISDLIRRS